MHWFGKPLAMAPSLVARFGWASVDADVLECELCHERVEAVDVGGMDERAVGEAVGAFVSRLVSAHRETCQWRDKSVPESFVRFPVRTAPAIVAEVQERMRVLEAAAGGLPPVKLPEDARAAAAKMAGDAGGDVALRAATMAMTGWLPAGEKQTFFCSLGCRARVAVDVIEGDFDVVLEHRAYCPWVAEKVPVVHVTKAFAEREAAAEKPVDEPVTVEAGDKPRVLARFPSTLRGAEAVDEVERPRGSESAPAETDDAAGDDAAKAAADADDGGKAADAGAEDEDEDEAPAPPARFVQVNAYKVLMEPHVPGWRQSVDAIAPPVHAAGDDAATPLMQSPELGRTPAAALSFVNERLSVADRRLSSDGPGPSPKRLRLE